MYIAPNTVIKIIKDCPLDTTYQHTLYWATKSAQSTYFSSIAKYTLSAQTYQRVNKGSMRVQYKAEDLYDCNYLMFQNTAFGDKWFYAFITSVEYINNITSEITFQLDVMQTWYFDYDLGYCFVEREHSATDVTGENLVPENLELGDYVSSTFTGTNLLNEQSIVVAANFDENYDDIGGTFFGGLFTGLYYHVFPNTRDGAIDAADFISGAKGKSDGIVSVFLMPTAMTTEVGGSVATASVAKPKNFDLLGDYTPKNNKLYTYPYTFLYVTNLQGNAAAYHYEYFNSAQCVFTLAGDMSPSPNVVLAPRNYKGVTVNYDEKLVLGGYPQLPFNTDSFKAWLAQNASNLAVEALSTAAGLANTGDIDKSLSSGINILQSTYRASIMPDQARGGAGSITNCAIGIQDFAFMTKHIRPEMAKIIDDYFSMYGYACRQVKIPNRNVRQNWTYTKTVNCDLIGSVPADDMRAIAQIYDKGVTFWNKPANVGKYNLSNKPTGG